MDLYLETNVGGSVELKWDNTRFGNNNKELFLVDEEQGILIDMRSQNSYSTSAKSSRSFEIYFGADVREKITPKQIVLGQAYPNPASELVHIPFALPDNPATYRVGLEVIDLLGRKIATLVDEYLPSGFYTTVWDTQQSHLNSGIYIYRLMVSNSNLNVSFNKKITID